MERLVDIGVEDPLTDLSYFSAVRRVVKKRLRNRTDLSCQRQRAAHVAPVV